MEHLRKKGDGANWTAIASRTRRDLGEVARVSLSLWLLLLVSMRAVIEEVMCEEKVLETKWLDKSRLMKSIRSMKPKGPRSRRSYGGFGAKLWIVIIIAVLFRRSFGITSRKKRSVDAGNWSDIGETSVVSVSDYQPPQLEFGRPRRRDRQAGWQDRLHYDEGGSMPVPMAPWSEGRERQCGIIHVDIHVGGRKLRQPRASDGSNYVYDVEVDLESGRFKIDDPGRTYYDDVFGRYVDPGHDGNNGFVRRRACGDSSQVVAEVLNHIADGIFAGAVRAKSQRLNATDYVGRADTVRRIRVLIRCKSGRYRGTAIAGETAFFCETAGYTLQIHHETLYKGVEPDPYYARRYQPDDRGPCGCNLGLCRIFRGAYEGLSLIDRRNAEDQERQANTIADQAFEDMMAPSFAKIIPVDQPLREDLQSVLINTSYARVPKDEIELLGSREERPSTSAASPIVLKIVARARTLQDGIYVPLAVAVSEGPGSASNASPPLAKATPAAPPPKAITALGPPPPPASPLPNAVIASAPPPPPVVEGRHVSRAQPYSPPAAKGIPLDTRPPPLTRADIAAASTGARDPERFIVEALRRDEAVPAKAKSVRPGNGEEAKAGSIMPLEVKSYSKGNQAPKRPPPVFQEAMDASGDEYVRRYGATSKASGKAPPPKRGAALPPPVPQRAPPPDPQVPSPPVPQRTSGRRDDQVQRPAGVRNVKARPAVPRSGLLY